MINKYLEYRDRFMTEFRKVFNGSDFILEALVEKKVVGVIKSRYFKNNTLQIDTFEVAEAYRCQGIGTQLFNHFQKSALEDKIGGIGFEYDADSPYAVAIEKILKKAGWSPPRLYLIRCTFDVEQFNPLWYQKHLNQALPSNMRIVSWKRITNHEKEVLRIQASQGRFMGYLSPLNEEQKIEPLNSLGLKEEKNLIGWMITHRKDKETIEYFSLYIEKEFHLKGYAMTLLAKSIQLQKKSSIKWAFFEIKLKEIDPSWRSFVKKRLIPYAFKIQRFKWALHLFPEYLSLY